MIIPHTLHSIHTVGRLFRIKNIFITQKKTTCHHVILFVEREKEREKRFEKPMKFAWLFIIRVSCRAGVANGKKNTNSLSSENNEIENIGHRNNKKWRKKTRKIAYICSYEFLFRISCRFIHLSVFFLDKGTTDNNKKIVIIV